MQHAADSASTIEWRPRAAPKTACALQAVLVSAVISVVFQSILNWFVDVPAIFLHLGSWVIILPIVWKWRHQLSWVFGQTATDVFSRIDFGRDAINGQLKSNGNAVALQVTEVERFFGAIQVGLTPTFGALDDRLALSGSKKVVITIWHSSKDKEKFRKLSTLALWHARRVA